MHDQDKCMCLLYLGFEVYRYSKVSHERSEIFGQNQKSVIGKLPIFD